MYVDEYSVNNHASAIIGGGFNPEQSPFIKMTDDEYSQAEGVRKSSLDRIATSPATVHLPWNGSKSTDFGSLVHCLVLTPENFFNDFVVEPEFNKRTTAGKEEAEAFAEENKSKIIIKKTELEKAQGMREQVMCCIGDWLEHPSTIIEHALFWVDPITGIKCKCKPDIYVASENMVIDLKKTAERATANDFARSVGAYRYHVQKAFYLDGLLANGIEGATFNFCPISLQANGGTGLFALDEETTKAGYNTMRSDLELYAACLASSNWPRLPSRIQIIALKSWH
jgi:exodeoxyribonuclease VIII